MQSQAYVYILQSQTTGTIYTGSTRDLDTRLKAHNAGKVRSTKAGRPYAIIHSEVLADYSLALQRERFLKSGAGREWIQRNVLTR